MEGLLEFLWGAAKAAVPTAALVLIIGWIGEQHRTMSRCRDQARGEARGLRLGQRILGCRVCSSGFSRVVSGVYCGRKCR